MASSCIDVLLLLLFCFAGGCGGGGGGGRGSSSSSGGDICCCGGESVDGCGPGCCWVPGEFRTPSQCSACLPCSHNPIQCLPALLSQYFYNTMEFHLHYTLELFSANCVQLFPGVNPPPPPGVPALQSLLLSYTSMQSLWHSFTSL